MTKKERADRRRRLIVYLRRTGNLTDAKRLAAEDNVSENTSVWIGALGDMIAERLAERLV